MKDEGKGMIMRLSAINPSPDYDIDSYLINLLYGQPEIPETSYDIPEDWYVSFSIMPFLIIFINLYVYLLCKFFFF